MLAPRFNRVRVLLPETMLPKHILVVYRHVLKNAGLLRLYKDNPINCLQESLTGIDGPGININLVEQTKRDPSGVATAKHYYPMNANSRMSAPNDSVTLAFRHIDGFHNYWMLFMAVNYIQNHIEQSRRNDTYLHVGDIHTINRLTEDFDIHMTLTRCVYDSIDGLSQNFGEAIKRGEFSVGLKFFEKHMTLWYKGRQIMELSNLQDLDNMLPLD